MRLGWLILIVGLWCDPVAAESKDPAAQLNADAYKLLDRQDFAAAIPLLESALALREQALGPKSPWVQSSLADLGLAYGKTGNPRTEATWQRALTLADELYGAASAQSAQAASYLGVHYIELGDMTRAIPLMERSVAAFEKLNGPKHRDVVATLLDLGRAYRGAGDRRAEATLLRALVLSDELFGKDSSESTYVAEPLARYYIDRSEWVRAERLLQHIHVTRIRLRGEGDPSTLAIANLLAQTALQKGDLPTARTIIVRAQSFVGDVKDQTRLPMMIAILSTTADVMLESGDGAAAIQALRFAVTLHEKAYGSDNRGAAKLLQNLGTALAVSGQLDEATKVMQEVVRREAKIEGGSGAMGTVKTLVTIAELQRLKGDLAAADRLYRALLPIAERAIGRDHPLYAQALLNNHATVLAGLGRVGDAWPLLRAAARSHERAATESLQTGSEAERVLFMRQLAGVVSVVVMLALDPRAPKTGVAEALELVLQFKGRSLDASATTASALRRAGPAEQKLLGELAAARRELGAMAFRGGDKATNLEARALELERRLASSATGVIEPPVSLEAVRKALPSGAALVELVAYRPVDLRGGPTSHDHRKWGDHRYVAYVLEATGAPRQVDLGDGPTIDRAVGALIEVMSKPDRDAKSAAREVDRLVMAKIRPLLHSKWLFVSPDLALSSVPFHALVDEHGRYALEDYAITALTSGRDLLRRPRATRAGGPAVFGDPDFGDGQPSTVPGERSSELGTIRFSALAGTRDEVTTLGGLLPNARVLTGAAASEAAIKKLAGPPILHIATHGFFLTDLDGGADGTRAVKRVGGPTAIPENPLLRSGLAFAGANPRVSEGGEDGILTALEASGLDLDGTRLVVLSACESGVGATGGADGVRGLGRAFVLAGAETLVTSLWKVPDEATRDLMIDYYKRLAAGGGRGEAMRQAQLAMLRNPATRHPYYWASFVVSGDASAIDGTPVLPKVERGARGCGCSGTGPSSSGGAALLALALLLASGGRRGRRATIALPDGRAR